VARITGPIAAVQLVVAGAAGFLVYLPIAISRDEAREWLSAVRRRGSPVPAPRAEATEHEPTHAYRGSEG
jgi:hypothetical protein